MSALRTTVHSVYTEPTVCINVCSGCLDVVMKEVKAIKVKTHRYDYDESCEWCLKLIKLETDEEYEP